MALILLCCHLLLSQKHGLVIIPEDTPNGDVSHESPTSGITVVKQEVAQVLESAGDGPLGEFPNTLSCIFILVWNNGIIKLISCLHTPDVRLRKLAEEKDELLSQVWLYMKWFNMDYWHRWVEVTHLRSFRSENWKCSWRKNDKNTQRSTAFIQKENEWRTALTCISSRCRVRPLTLHTNTLKPALPLSHVPSHALTLSVSCRGCQQTDKRIQIQALKGWTGNGHNGTKCEFVIRTKFILIIKMILIIKS